MGKILTSDDAREMFAKAIKPGKETMFLQMDSESSAPAQHAYAVLKRQATKTHSLRLAQVAASIRTTKSGHFDKVIKSIDEIIGNLKKEEADDIKKRDECKDKFLEIESTVRDLDWKIENLIEEHREEKAKTIEEIGNVNQQLEDMLKQ